MMVCVLLALVSTVLLTEASPTPAPSGPEQDPPCPPRWLLFGHRCFALHPVWSSWSSANSACSQTGGNLLSLHTPEERQFARQLASTHTPVWLGGYQVQQNGSWFWSDGSPFRISDWTNQKPMKSGEGGACMSMEPKSGELHGAPCGELRFYICSTRASSKVTENKKPAEPGIGPRVSLFDVVWGFSNSLVEEILRSSTFLRELRSGHLTQRCYTSFMQQEALYLHGVSSTLQALVSSLQEIDDLTSLLLDTVKLYSSRNQSLLTPPPPPPPPQWLRFSLQSFHLVVLEEPVYWLVALSARACLRTLLSEEPVLSESGTDVDVEASSFYQEWSAEGLKEVAWTQRYRKLLEKHQDQMDVFKAVNIFREHMMNQKSFYKSVVCDVDDDK